MPRIEMKTATTRQYEVCIAGAGPAGCAAALALSEAGHRVLLIDAGHDLPEPGPGARCSNPAAHEVSDITHCRALGGTSWLWGGRIMPFGQDEFTHHNWPVAYETYAQHLEEAAAFLGGSASKKPFLQAEQDESGNFDLNAMEMLAADGPVSQRHASRLQATSGPDILLSVTVVGLLMEHTPEAGAYCKGVRVQPTPKAPSIDIQAQQVVVAMGGIETTRLLLSEKARHPAVLGHLSALGHFYSGHLTGSIANIVFPKRVNIQPFGWHPTPTGSFERQVFRSREALVKDGSNMFFWAKNWPAEDARHGSGILSAKHLLSRIKGTVGTVSSSGPGAPEAISASPILAHMSNLFTDLTTSVFAAPSTCRAMMNGFRKHLDHLIPNGANCYRLNYHAEQEQRAENRIELLGSVAPDQLPEIQIHYDYSDTDIEAILRGHSGLAQDLERTGLAKLTYSVAPNEMANAVRQKAQDGYHQIGVTRMGHDPRNSVVDGNCQLHGVSGLHVAGSGIFPSSGAAPPTQSIVAFSFRLAQHLSSKLQSLDESFSVAPEWLAQSRGCPKR